MYSNFNLVKTRRRDKRFVKCVTEVNKSPIQSNQKNTKISGFPLLVIAGSLDDLTVPDIFDMYVCSTYTSGMFQKLVIIVLGIWGLFDVNKKPFI